MKNTPQIIGVRALLTFAVLEMAPQQMFAHPLLVSSDKQTNVPAGSFPWKAVVISEIMADPSPPQGLPEVEYLELFNRTDATITLEGWELSDATSSATLVDFKLESRQYVVIASKPVGTNTMIVPNLPSLNNAGDSLTLTDAQGNVIDVVNYSDDWYHYSQHSGGGWSLELIDLDNTCELSGNWSAAEAERGGTPGQQNSIEASNPDLTGPYLISVDVVDNLKLRLVFNEKLAAEALVSGEWIIEPSIDVYNRSFVDSSRTTIVLVLSAPLIPGVLYSLSLLSVFDCAGNAQQTSQRASFALPEPANPGDLVINELLFNPRSDGVDFVELFNASDKYIDLNGWAIGSLDVDGDPGTSFIEQSTILRPGGYVAFTTDPDILKSQYAAADSTIRQLKLPSLGDDAGTVIVLNNLDSIIDRFNYTASMHNVFIRDAEGVSLERISPALQTADVSNWTSATPSSGFGTPGSRNSNSRKDSPSNNRPVQVTPPVFTPLSGQPNAAEISYQLDGPGYIATVNICDSRGMVIRRLANNLPLATEGILRWEGDRDDGGQVQSGYYMVWFQVFAADGSSKLFRESVAVSPRF